MPTQDIRRTLLLAMCLWAMVLNQPLPADTETGPIQVRLTVAENQTLQSEPVIAIVEIKNISKMPQTLDLQLRPAFGILSYRISGPNGGEHRWEPMMLFTIIFDPQTLAPGESVVHRQLLLLSPNWGVHFEEPGTYHLEALYFHKDSPAPDKMLKSNRVAVTVEPATGVDARALDRFEGRPQARAVMGGTQCIAIRREFDDIIAKYPNTRYAPWSYYTLGRSWQSWAAKDQNERRTSGRKGYNRLLSEKAIRMYETLLKDHPDFPLAVDARYQIAKEMLRLGKEGAMERIETLIKEHPNLHLLQQAQMSIRELRETGYEVTAGELP